MMYNVIRSSGENIIKLLFGCSKIEVMQMLDPEKLFEYLKDFGFNIRYTRREGEEDILWVEVPHINIEEWRAFLEELGLRLISAEVKPHGKDYVVVFKLEGRK